MRPVMLFEVMKGCAHWTNLSIAKWATTTLSYIYYYYYIGWDWKYKRYLMVTQLTILITCDWERLVRQPFNIFFPRMIQSLEDIFSMSHGRNKPKQAAHIYQGHTCVHIDIILMTWTVGHHSRERLRNLKSVK